jgi:putative addiction module component (TIGR02574 family)
MVGSAKKHVDELLKLSPDERSEAAEQLLRSLEDEADAEDQNAVATAWASEIERRVDEGEPGVSAETVFSEARARLQKRS